jgi:hypothetical protein
MSEVRTLSIPQRFCGPPRWANGGFSCGSFAAGIDGAAEVTLRKPIPLDQQILIEADGDGYTATGDDGELLAEARPAAALDGLRPPARPSIEEAAAASADSPFRGPDHTYPGCFVCGPQHPDGLEIFVGPLERGADDPEAFADRFTIDPALAEDDGNAGPGLVWAALDCPSFVPPFWAYAPVLLGRLTAEQLEPVPTGESLVAVSWPLEIEGRKLHSASAVLDGDGQVLARARALWIQLRQPVAT